MRGATRLSPVGGLRSCGRGGWSMRGRSRGRVVAVGGVEVSVADASDLLDEHVERFGRPGRRATGDVEHQELGTDTPTDLPPAPLGQRGPHTDLARRLRPRTAFAALLAPAPRVLGPHDHRRDPGDRQIRHCDPAPARSDALWLGGQCLRSRPDRPRPSRDDHADEAAVIAEWAPSQPWGTQRAVAVAVIGSYRLDRHARVGLAFPSRNLEGRP